MKKKVLMIGPAPPPHGGGMQTFIEDILGSELPKIVELKLLNTIVPDIYFKYRPLRLLLFFKFIFLLIIDLIIFRPEIVHIHTSSYTGFWEKALFVIISKTFSRKVILHIHGSSFNKFCKNSRFKMYIYRILDLCDKLIVLSNYWSEFFKNNIAEEKLVIVENGININHFSHIPHKEKTINILFIGSIGERKGLYVILESIINSTFLQKPIFQFNFIGGGIFKKDFEHVVDSFKGYNIRNVHFHGKLIGDDKYEYFRKADIFILPSYAEGLPIAILEAMASYLPVISTKVGGIPDLIKSQNGILINSGDSKALSEAILTLANDSELRKRIGQNNRKEIEDNYTISTVVRKIMAIYKNI